MELNDKIAQWEKEKDQVSEKYKYTQIDFNSAIEDLEYDLTYRPRTVNRVVHRDKIKILSRLADLEESISNARLAVRRARRVTRIHTEGDAGEMTMDNDITKIHIQQTLEDVEGASAAENSAGSTSYEDIGQSETKESKLQDFFSRPVKIAGFSTAVGADVWVLYNVWDLYLKDPTIRAKIRNASSISGDLYVKVMISGTPYHVGVILASYQPYHNKNTTLQELSAAYAIRSGMRPLVLNYLSQAPGAIIMDIKDNQPAIIRCPFLSFKNSLRLYNSNTAAISAATSFVDAVDFGALYLMSLNTLGCIQIGTASDIYIYVYAWMENVKLGPPTGTQLAITTEGDHGKDERYTGPVEKISSAVAHIANQASDLPVIGKYSKASEMMANGISKAAAVLGWSRPNVVPDPTFVKNNPFVNGALTIASDTGHRIVLDPEQEVTVDPRIAGVDTDDMILAEICKRPAYLTSFQWTSSDVSMVSLWNCIVHPCINTSHPGVTYTNYQPTPVGFVQSCFEYWHGKMNYKFQVVCSKYHRGKLGFFFEPNVYQHTLINANLKMNRQYFAILDLQEASTVDYCISWAAPRAWQRCNKGNNSTQYGTNFDPTLWAESANGYIGVTVINELQSPNNSGCDINVFVWSDEMHVNMFTDTNIPQERRISTEGDSGDLLPTETTCIELNKSSADDSMISVNAFGEEPVSFRSLLKRFHGTERQWIAGTGNYDGWLSAIFNNIPENQVPYRSAAGNYMDMFSYLRYAYLAIRGGVKKRFVLGGNYDVKDLAQVKVFNQPIVSNNTKSIAYSSTLELAKPTGTVSFVPSSNGGIEFEVPWYSPNLFAFSFADDLIGPDNEDNSYVTLWMRQHKINMKISVKSANEMGEESAAGEDFSFMRFQGAPFFSA